MDPVTGYPAMGTRSVRVVTDEGVFVDGFDNVFFVLGPEKGMKLVHKINKDFSMGDHNRRQRWYTINAGIGGNSVD